MKNMLIDDRPILFLPQLAMALDSVERAIILQQIHWLLQQPKSGRIVDGHKWVWGTYEEWCEDYFPMWKPQNLAKHIRKLESDGVLISAEHNARKHDHTKHYRINYEHELLQPIVSDSMVSESDSNTPSVLHSDTASVTSDSIASLYTETSAKNTTKNSAETAARSVALPPADAADSSFLKAIKAYTNDINDIHNVDGKGTARKVPPSTLNSIRQWCKSMGEDTVIEAIEEAATQGARTWKYVTKKLEGWKEIKAKAEEEAKNVYYNAIIDDNGEVMYYADKHGRRIENLEVWKKEQLENLAKLDYKRPTGRKGKKDLSSSSNGGWDNLPQFSGYDELAPSTVPYKFEDLDGPVRVQPANQVSIGFHEI